MKPGHNVGEENMFYHYRPEAPGCSIAAADVTLVGGAPVLLPTSQNTYPEYDRIWSDKTLKMAIVFSRNVPGQMLNDAGGNEFLNFNAKLQGKFAARSPVVTSTTLPNPAGRAVQKQQWELDLDATHHLSIQTYLVDLPQSGGAAFEAELAQVSATSDFLSYAGHAGLGVNIDAFLSRVRSSPSKYRVLMLQNCNSFAYNNFVLTPAPNTITGANGNQDVVVNALPSNFSDNTPMLFNWVVGLSQPNAPKPFLDILPREASGRPVVLFDDDNHFHP